MILPPSTNSWMTRVRAMVPASAMWHPATVRPGSALWRTLRDNRQWLRSLRKLTPLRTHVREPSRLCKNTLRNYDNDGSISHRLHRRCWYSTLRPTRLAWRVRSGSCLSGSARHHERGEQYPQFTRADQNIAAIAMLLCGVPEPIDPQERAVYQNLRVLVEAPAVQ